MYPKTLRKSRLTSDFKECLTCRIVKPRSEFAKRVKSSSGWQGIQSYCKDCTSLSIKEWKNRNSEYIENRELFRKYGITLKEYNEMLINQNNSCKICFGPSGGRGRYHVDHDHSTGNVRGLLCHNCNTSLGLLKENKESMKRMIRYLEGNI